MIQIGREKGGTLLRNADQRRRENVISRRELRELSQTAMLSETQMQVRADERSIYLTGLSDPAPMRLEAESEAAALGHEALLARSSRAAEASAGVRNCTKPKPDGWAEALKATCTATT